MDGWINKPWSIPMLDYYSASKRSEALTHATQKDPEHTVLGERRQTQKAPRYAILFL